MQFSSFSSKLNLDESFPPLHEYIHKIGYLVFGAAGNKGVERPHEPWGSCKRCIIVGGHSHNLSNEKVTGFSSGCCRKTVTIFARATNFALAVNEPKCHGTSLATAIVSASITTLIPTLWDVDTWRTFHNVVKHYLTTIGRPTTGCNNEVTAHQPQTWIKFFVKDENQSVEIGSASSTLHVRYIGVTEKCGWQHCHFSFSIFKMLYCTCLERCSLSLTMHILVAAEKTASPCINSRLNQVRYEFERGQI